RRGGLRSASVGSRSPDEWCRLGGATSSVPPRRAAETDLAVAVQALRGMDAVDLLPRDGSTPRFRPPRPSDEQALVDFFQALSERSLYLRFHGYPALGPPLVAQLLEPDWVERGALLGTFAEDGSERVVAVGNYVRLGDPSRAEAGVAVADAYERRGG